MQITFIDIYFLTLELAFFFFFILYVIYYFIEKFVFKRRFDSFYLVLIIIALIIFLVQSIFFKPEVFSTVYFFNNYFIYNNLIGLLKSIMLFILLIYFFLVFNYNKIIEIPIFEYTVLILIAFLGLLLLTISNNLFVMLLLLELINLCIYCLIGINKHSNFGIEAAFKYFAQSAFATIIGFFGVSLVYLSAGSLFINELSLLNSISELNHLTFLGIYFILLSFFFKIGLFPLHSWLPDVYQSSLLITLAFIAIIPKIPYIFIFFRLIYEFDKYINIFIYLIALISIIYGSIITLYQTTFRRFIAYGSMVHMSFILISLSIGLLNMAASFFYLFFYIALTLFNFSIMLLFFEKNNYTIYFIDDLSKLSALLNKNKLLIYLFSFILLSFAGLPFFVGFVSKWYIFLSFLEKGAFLELFLILVMSIINAAYYIRLIRFLFFFKNKLIKVNYYTNINYKKNLYYLILFLFILNIIIIFFHNHIYIYILNLIINIF